MKPLAAERPARYLGHIDSLRGLAIFGVLVVHAGFSVLDAKDSALTALVFAGQRGVQLFYMVSAFTLFYSLDAQRKERHETRNFYLRRFFRIAPLYYLDLLFRLAILGLGGLRPILFLSAFFFLNGWSHSGINGGVPGGWSIAVETTFYLFVPLLFTKIRTLGQALWTSLALTAAAELLSYALAPRAFEYFTFLWFPVELPVFLLGIITYFLWKGLLPSVEALPFGPSSAGRNIVTRQGLAWVLIFFAAALLFGTVNSHAVMDSTWRNNHLLLSSLGFVPLILALSFAPVRWLDNRFTRLLGRISYSVYLSHPYLIMLLEWIHLRYFPGVFHGRLHNTALGALGMLLLLTLVAMPVSYLLWRFVEQPGVRLGRRLIAHLEHRAALRAESLVPPVAEAGMTGNSSDAQF